jgi:transposase InsO family protein
MSVQPGPAEVEEDAIIHQVITTDRTSSVTATTTTSQIIKGLADSGASRSIIDSVDHVLHPVSCKKQMHDAGGTTHHSTHTGTVVLQVQSDSGDFFNILIPVLVVPTMTGLIINTTYLHQHGKYTGSIGPKGTTWRNSIGYEYTCPILNNQEFFVGTLQDQIQVRAVNDSNTPLQDDADIPTMLHHLKSQDCSRVDQDTIRVRLANLGCITTKDANDRFLQLHCRLGHRSVRDTLAAARHLRIPIGKYAQIVCDTCQRVKQKKQPVNKKRANPLQYNNFECWHVDSYQVSEAQRSLFGQHRYILGFIDVATRTAIPIFLPSVTSKSVELAMEQFIIQARGLIQEASRNEIKISLGPNIKTDSAAYFKSRGVTNVFRKHGFIRIHQSPPHTQSMNGRIERWFQTISGSAMAMIASSGLSKSLWPQAFRHATHIYDMMPHRELGTSPYEARNGKPPDISNLHIWGSRCWCWKNTKRVRKGDNKGTPGHYMGYDPTTASHWVWTKNAAGAEWLTNAYHVTIDDKIPMRVLQGIVPETPSDIDVPEIDVIAAIQERDEVSYRTVRYYNYAGARRDPQWGKYFIGSLDNEVLELIKMGALKPIQLRDIKPHETINQSTCMYTIKKQPPGYKGKCRLVFAGKNQKKGRDYDFKTTMQPSWPIVRMHLATTPRLPDDDELCLIDIKKAFTRTKNFTPDGHRVLLRLPSDAVYVDDSGVKWQHMIVDAALYGQVNAGYLWQQCLWKFMKELGWRQAADMCTWIKGSARVTIWTDDIIYRGPRDARDEFLRVLNVTFPGCTISNGSRILGHQVTRQPNGCLKMTSGDYIREAAQRFQVNTKNLTPLPAGIVIHRTSAEEYNPQRAKLYQEMIGVISWLAVTTRPDVSFTASALGQAAANPSRQHLKYAKRTMGYLLRTADMEIKYASGNNDIKGYADASFAENIDSKSQSGFVIMMNGGPVSWRSKCQTYASISTQESEIVAACDCIRDIQYLRDVLDSWNVPGHWETHQSSPTILYEDNQAAISYFQGGNITQRNKHFATKLEHIRRCVYQDKIIDIQYVETDKQLADIFTKSLANEKQSKFTFKLIASILESHIHKIFSIQ